jgi:hypothetical protein
MPIVQKAIGHGEIIWLGINRNKGVFSELKSSIFMGEDGVDGDMYRGMWRTVSGHDVDYIATDNIEKGDAVLNLRQITIVCDAELRVASHLVGMSITPGMLRENMGVSFTSDYPFSKLPPMSRMVIGAQKPKVLLLTEENGPCRTIVQPIAVHFQKPGEVDALRQALEHRRGMMAMVRSEAAKCVWVGDTFKVFPPM